MTALLLGFLGSGLGYDLKVGDPAPGVNLKTAYAWLESHGGVWHLLTHVCSDRAEAARIWADRDEALSDLAAEGWTIAGPYPETVKIGRQRELRFCGYALTRTVH